MIEQNTIYEQNIIKQKVLISTSKLQCPTLDQRETLWRKKVLFVYNLDGVMSMLVTSYKKVQKQM